MDTSPPPSDRRLGKDEIRRAIGSMAIDQSILALAVVHLLKRIQTSEPDDEGLNILVRSIDSSVDRLSKLAERLMDAPHDP